MKMKTKKKVFLFKVFHFFSFTFESAVETSHHYIQIFRHYTCYVHTIIYVAGEREREEKEEKIFQVQGE